MRKIIREIRQQPLHVRKIFVWTLTTLTFSLVVIGWAGSTQKRVVAMLNGPQKTSEQTEVANKQPSPFAAIKKSFKDLSAAINEFWSNREEFSPSKFQKSVAQSPLPTNKLPVE